MRIIGLTGGIAMGKSTVAGLLRAAGVPVHDADAAVHRLLAPGGAAVAAVAARFPGTRDPAGGIDRRALGRQVFGHRGRLTALERLLHPLVRREADRFLARCRLRGCPRVVLEIPLLFETGAERRCDAVWTVSAPAFVQARRVLARPGMTPARLAAIRARQWDDASRCRRADAVIPTGLGLATTRRVLTRTLAAAPSARSKTNR